MTIGYAESAIKIGSYAFNGLIGNSVVINRNIDINTTDWQGKDMVAECLFADSTVKTIVLPDSMDQIGPSMFNGCYNLTDIFFNTPTEPQHINEDSDKKEQENIINKYTSTSEVTLPMSITRICTQAFTETPNISKLNIHAGVNYVESSAFVGWKEPQEIHINAQKESDLTWDPSWKLSCDPGVIQFNGVFTISYNLNGGNNNSNNPASYSSQEKVILYDATRTGYKFAGWYTDETFNSEQIVTINKGTTGDIVLYAKWERNKYNIKYESNDPLDASSNVIGNMPNSTHSFDIESNLSPNLYYLSGWKFIGWNTNVDGTGVSYQDKQIILNLSNDEGAEITLYAQWCPISYQIIYHSNKPNSASGLMTGNMETSSHIYDVETNLNKNTYKLVGWTFTGWNTQFDGKGDNYDDKQSISNLSIIDKSDVTLFAQWKQIEYSVSFASNKPINASNPLIGNIESISAKYDTTYTLPANNYSLLGWTFNGWNTKADGTGTSFKDKDKVSNLSEISKIVTLYAQWDAIEYKFKYEKNKPTNASNQVMGITNESNHLYDTDKALSTNGYSLVGWTFKGWNTQANGTGKSFKDKDNILNYSSDSKTITVYAQWVPNEYDIVYDKNKPSNASGSISGTIENSHATYEIDCTLRKNTYALVGWVFAGWNTKADGKGANYSDNVSVKNLTLSKSITLYAKWTAINYTVTYNSNKPTTSTQNLLGSMTNSSFVYDNNSTLPKSAYSMKGYTFKGWATSSKGAVVFGDQQTIKNPTLNGNSVTLYAVWEIIKYNIYTKNLDTGEVRKSDTYTVESGKTFQDSCYNGYTLTYSVKSIPKGTIGDQTVGYTRREISYILELEYYADGGKQLSSTKRYTLKYTQEMSFTAPSFSGYTFRHFAHLKNPSFPAPGMPEVPPSDLMDIYRTQTMTVSKLTTIPDSVYTFRAVYEKNSSDGCVATGTLITLANGSNVPVESLKGDEKLLVWNLYTGSFDVAPILFIDSDSEQEFEIINLLFSDGTSVKVISEHAFWDCDLNKYVFLRADAAKYIGHWFNKQITGANGEMEWTKVQLVDVELTTEITTAWSPVTYGHLCYYVNGMLSMPGATESFINIFDVDAETMKIDEAAFEQDIETYGLFTYEEFSEILPIPEVIFEAFGGQYLKVAIGKGLTTMEELAALIQRYEKFFN